MIRAMTGLPIGHVPTLQSANELRGSSGAKVLADYGAMSQSVTQNSNPPNPISNEYQGEGSVIAEAVSTPAAPKQNPLPKEIGGRDGPEPTRFGDWEKSGRCIDF
jgi:hypothetical protein